MRFITSFIQGFVSRAGNYILISTILARLLSFLASWIALQLIENKELGVVLFAFNIISFFIPIGGLGLHQSLIRYGTLLNTQNKKHKLFIYVFKKGILASFTLVLLIIGTSFFIEFSFNKTRYYVNLLSLIVIPTYILELIKTQFRLQHDNKSFSFIELTYNFILVITVLILSYLYKEKGYALALLISPLLASLLFFRKLRIDFSLREKLDIIDLSFFKYGIFSSLANVVTQLLFVIDIFLIGYLMNNSEMVTNYKYISLIPFSLLFLSRVFITTDFVSFTEKIYDQNYITKYIKGYIGLFLVVSLIIILFSLLFSKQILLLFGSSFENYSESFIILIFGICGILILRGLFGNLLSSLGKAHLNYYIVSIALLINVMSNYYLIPKYGIKGAAITSAILMWFTGIASCVWFYILYRKIKKQSDQ